jgi:hypothetical protein
MTATLDTTLMEELTTSIGGCLGTLEMALAVTKDVNAQRALTACLSVLATSYEHLCRVEAMVFSHERPEPAGPLTMGQEEEGECQHLDLLGPLPGGSLVCRDCAEEVAGE